MDRWQPQVGRVALNQGGLLRTLSPLMKAGRLDEARALLAKAAAADPDFAAAHLLLGNACFREGRYEEALDAYRRALEIDPRLVPAPLVMMTLHRIAHEPQCALARLDDPAGALTSMTTSAQQGRQQLLDARDSVKQALAADPRSLPARLLLAEIQSQSGESEAAMAMLTALLAERPELAIARQMLGLLQAQSGQYAQARANLQAVVQQRPGKPAPLFVLGHVHLKLAEASAAQKCFREASTMKIGRFPFLAAKYALADVLAASGRHVEAIAALDEILAVAGRSHACHQRLGAIYVAQGRYGRAIEEFRAALNRDPTLLENDPTIDTVLDAAAGEEVAARAFLARLSPQRGFQPSRSAGTQPPIERWRPRRPEPAIRSPA